MKRTLIPLTVLLLLGWLALESGVDAQVRVRIKSSSSSRPSSNDNQKEDPNPNEVQPIEPSPEEAEQIDDLIERLGAPTLAQRDRAMSELAAFEAKALTQVREGRKHDNDEIANRCSILEEVILSEQGEYFLAARRLNLSIGELKNLVQNDVASLLSILKTRAQPGMVSLWARILAQLSARSQVFPTAEVCISIEGTTGYGQALARAAASGEITESVRNLLLLIVLYPPGDAKDTVETLTQLRYCPGGSIESSLGAGSELRGVYDAVAALQARDGNPITTQEDPEDAPGLRRAVALSMVGECSGEQLDGAGLPPLEEMTPMLLQAWLDLAARSGLLDRVSSAMDKLIQSGADARRVSIAAGAWARITPLTDVIQRFETLPLEAKLSVLDTLWLYPREPLTLQPFLVQLLGHESLGLRHASVQGLSQLRGRSTVDALVNTAIKDSETAPAALRALTPMADLLEPGQLKSLSDMLPGAGLKTRPWLARILMSAGNAKGLKPLLEEWKQTLPRNELPLAFRVLSQDTTTPAGAFAAARIAQNTQSRSDLEEFLIRQLDNSDLEMTRTLLGADTEEGFKLLREMAGNLDDAFRLTAMSSLALAGRDGDLIDDWIKRLAGEIKDPNPSGMGYAIALSRTDAAEEFRRNALQQGADSQNMSWVVMSYLNGRTSISREELLGVLFETPESAMRWGRYGGLLEGPLPPKAAENIATALAFNDSSFYSDPGMVLRLMDSGVDMLDVLYGESESPTPRNNNDILITALLGDPARAAEILDRTEDKEDGSNFIPLVIGRAWVNPDGDRERIARELSSQPVSTFGSIWRLREAADGDANALVELLDAFGRDNVRFNQGRSAGAEIVDQRWGSPSISRTGVADAAIYSRLNPKDLKSVHFAELFQSAPPEEWRDWWSCRRALLTLDSETGKYTFAELP